MNKDGREAAPAIAEAARDPEREAWLRGLRPGDRVAEVDDRQGQPMESYVVEMTDRPRPLAQEAPGQSAMIFRFEEAVPPFVLVNTRVYYDARGHLVPVMGLEHEAPHWTLRPFSLRMAAAGERRELLAKVSNFPLGQLSTEALREIFLVIQQDQGIGP